VHSVSIYSTGYIGAIIDNEDTARLAHALAHPLRSCVQFSGRSLLIAKLNQPDARLQKGRRQLNGGASGPLSGINYGVEARDENCTR
jgi:hypothetical protein